MRPYGVSEVLNERCGVSDTKETDEQQRPTPPPAQPPGERGGPKGPEPTRFGDWEKGGRCSDF